MKKLIVLILTLSLALIAAVGCTDNTEDTSSIAASSKAQTAKADLKTGLAVITSLKSSSEENGLAQTDSTVVAVTVDSSGKIANCYIDAVQTKINFSNTGKVTTNLNDELKTKNELKEAYNMKPRSGIGKEWYEQARAFADYCVGKTMSEIKGISLKEGVPADADLASSVTIHVTDLISAVEKAVNNAKDLGANAGDKLGLGIVSSIADSKDAGDKEGLAQVNTTYAAVTFSADDKITSCALDSSQSKINFDKTGKITTDLSISPKTKVELGDAYGMKKQSGIGKEWFEQAQAFASYVTGKTPTDVNSIALTEGTPAGADLTASVTMHVTDFIDVIKKAAVNKK